MLTKIVHRTRECVGIIEEVQHIDGPLQVKHWGRVRPPVTPMALTRDAYSVCTPRCCNDCLLRHVGYCPRCHREY